MRFEFATAGRIIFGPGTLAEIGTVAKAFGRMALVVTGRNLERARPLKGFLADSGVRCTLFSVAGEPEITTVQEGLAAARKAGCDLVIGFGGGSALDAGKAIAAMLANEGDLLEYLEVIGQGKALEQPSAPYIAVPTTAGTGTEVTRNAVLASPTYRVKVSLRSAWMLPRVALVDPELTFALPPPLTASTGLDALTQLIEPYVSSRANPVTDALCEEGMRRVARSLRTAFVDSRNAAVREDMSLASLFGGLALANAGLGAVHGLAGPLGGMFPAPHGAICAALLPHVFEINLRALRQRQPKGETLRRFQAVARLLTGDPAAEPEDGTAWLRELVGTLKIPSLGTYGVTSSDVPQVVPKAGKASSMKANPIALTAEELSEALERSL
jgi:alcohol dehydrogenase class IV